MKQETGRRIARWSYMAVAAGYLWWNLARMTEFSWTFTIMPYLGDFGIIVRCKSLLRRSRLRHFFADFGLEKALPDCLDDDCGAWMDAADERYPRRKRSCG